MVVMPKNSQAKKCCRVKGTKRICLSGFASSKVNKRMIDFWKCTKCGEIMCGKCILADRFIKMEVDDLED